MIQSLVDKSFVHRNYASTEYSLRNEVLRNLFFLKSPTICHGQKFSRKVDKKFPKPELLVNCKMRRQQSVLLFNRQTVGGYDILYRTELY